ncbi:YczE/YyaS/YitT family protein [Succinivibrio dextrinosolvens]|uniref:Uncharacterized membrane protein YczE n=1 Tax=Succinivibrio dextrinosolvens TaxID=83771 RepID=A0A662Z8U3_9GAMM|nr:hypothetical protein [Succinivibrio dextrinosolvens]SFK04275.1 Uncharacterized membrane protein YczE [Succinivibrio dextrinosolvens]
MQESFKKHLARVFILLVGLTIAHLGVTLFLIADLGADPFNVLIQGLFRLEQRVFNLDFVTHGRIHMMVSFLIIIVLLLTDKSYVRIGTLICMFLGGPIIDVFNFLLNPILVPILNMPVRLVLNVLGCGILAYGMTIVIKSEAGTGPNDLVAVVLSDKTHKKFAPVRVGVDLLFALSGFLLGGTVGIGTLICAFVVGPVAGYFLPHNERIIKNLIKNL